MPYFFGDDGTLTDHYDEQFDPRVFVVQGLQVCLARPVVESALKEKSPSSIHGMRVLLMIDEPLLRDIGATVFSETGAGHKGHNPEEAEGIARVIRNRADHRDVAYSSPKLFKVVGGGTMFGRNHEHYKDAMRSPIGNWTGDMSSDLGATIRAFVKASDITKGSYFWDGTAGVLKKTHPWVLSHWVGGNDPRFKGTVIEGTYTPLWVWKIDLARTSFFAYNPKGAKSHSTWP